MEFMVVLVCVCVCVLCVCGLCLCVLCGARGVVVRAELRAVCVAGCWVSRTTCWLLGKFRLVDLDFVEEACALLLRELHHCGKNEIFLSTSR